jgi:serine/threonine protein kinase
MTDETRQAAHDEAHRAFLQDTLRSVRHIMVGNYKITKVSIHPISEGASRLSNPIKIMGLNEHGEKVRYFGKVIGSKDIFTLRYIQFLKNISLQMNSHEPIFEIYETAEDMVRDQYKMMCIIYKSGIPAIKPYGYYSISNSQWLLVVEYLDAIPFAMLPEVTMEQIDTVFKYLKMAHQRNIFHGDIKPDNLLLGGDKIYILDAGHFRKDAPVFKKMSYDLACMISSFLGYQPVEDIVNISRNHYTTTSIQAAAKYVELIQMRPDIHFSDDTKKELLHHLTR